MKTLCTMQGRWRAFVVTGLLALVALQQLGAQAIPEPSLITYGVVRSGNIRLVVGTLTWRFQSGGRIVVVSTQVTNINDQFSYVLRVPCESEIAGFSVSSNVLRLISTATVYDRSQVTLTIDGNAYPVSFLNSSQNSLSVASRDRGLIEQIDLNVSIPIVDVNGNGIPDYWEYQYFGALIDANEDSDGDGLTNLAEFKAGTNPNDPNSRFAFINITKVPSGGLAVEWPSVQGIAYIVQRSGNLMNGFTNLATNIQATSPKNSYIDATALGAGPYFYRLKIQE